MNRYNLEKIWLPRYCNTGLEPAALAGLIISGIGGASSIAGTVMNAKKKPPSAPILDQGGGPSADISSPPPPLDLAAGQGVPAPAPLFGGGDSSQLLQTIQGSSD